ncbi:hypothetical protein HDU85_005927 [Gaertneriomyces sp. JEL0708]|nr:hypothetical protein HDU85_005927 [Gaertneriomyces sp. JEL0708]
MKTRKIGKGLLKVYSSFTEFINRGNVIELAVGIMMGTAFTAIVTSLVNDIIAPPFSVVTGYVSLSETFAVIKEGRFLSSSEYTTIQQAKDDGAVPMPYAYVVAYTTQGE